MTTLITVLVLTTVIAVPLFTESAAARSQNDVIAAGKNLGSDPDAKARLQLRRDHGSEGF